MAIEFGCKHVHTPQKHRRVDVRVQAGDVQMAFCGQGGSTCEG